MTDFWKAETARLILNNFENENSELRKVATSFKVKKLWLNTKNYNTVKPAKPNPKDEKDKKNKNKKNKN